MDQLSKAFTSWCQRQYADNIIIVLRSDWGAPHLGFNMPYMDGAECSEYLEDEYHDSFETAAAAIREHGGDFESMSMEESAEEMDGDFDSIATALPGLAETFGYPHFRDIGAFPDRRVFWMGFDLQLEGEKIPSAEEVYAGAEIGWDYEENRAYRYLKRFLLAYFGPLSAVLNTAGHQTLKGLLVRGSEHIGIHVNSDPEASWPDSDPLGTNLYSVKVEAYLMNGDREARREKHEAMLERVFARLQDDPDVRALAGPEGFVAWYEGGS